MPDAKPVLLVGNDQRQVLIFDPFAEQRLCADHQIPFARRDLPDRLPAIGCLHAAKQQPAADAKRFKQKPGAFQMLSGQYLRRRHQGCLMACLGRQARRRQRDGRLAAAHISLHQPAHGPAAREVRHDLIKHLGLRGCRIEPRLPPEGFDQPLISVHPDTGARFTPQASQRKLIEQEVFKGNAALGASQQKGIRRPVHLPQRFMQSAQIPQCQQAFRHRLRAQHDQIREQLIDQPRKHTARYAADRRVLGDDPPLPDHFGVTEGQTALHHLRPAIEKNTVAVFVLIARPGLVEPDNADRARFILRLGRHHVHALDIAEGRSAKEAQRKAHRFAGNRACHGCIFRAVDIAARKTPQQIRRCINAALVQRFNTFGPQALDLLQLHLVSRLP